MEFLLPARVWVHDTNDKEGGAWHVYDAGGRHWIADGLYGSGAYGMPQGDPSPAPGFPHWFLAVESGVLRGVRVRPA